MSEEEAKTSGRDAFVTDLIPDLIIFLLLLLMSYILTRDITARKRAEEALRQQREWLEFASCSQLVGLATLVLATRLTSVIQPALVATPINQTFGNYSGDNPTWEISR